MSTLQPQLCVFGMCTVFLSQWLSSPSSTPSLSLLPSFPHCLLPSFPPRPSPLALPLLQTRLPHRPPQDRLLPPARPSRPLPPPGPGRDPAVLFSLLHLLRGQRVRAPPAQPQRQRGRSGGEWERATGELVARKEGRGRGWERNGWAKRVARGGALGACTAGGWGEIEADVGAGLLSEGGHEDEGRRGHIRRLRRPQRQDLKAQLAGVN